MFCRCFSNNQKKEKTIENRFYNFLRQYGLKKPIVSSNYYQPQYTEYEFKKGNKSLCVETYNRDEIYGIVVYSKLSSNIVIYARGYNLDKIETIYYREESINKNTIYRDSIGRALNALARDFVDGGYEDFINGPKQVDILEKFRMTIVEYEKSIELSDVQKNAVLCYMYDSDMYTGGPWGRRKDFYLNYKPEEIAQAIEIISNSKMAEFFRSSIKDNLIDWKHNSDIYFSFEPSLKTYLRKYIDNNKEAIFNIKKKTTNNIRKITTQYKKNNRLYIKINDNNDYEMIYRAARGIYFDKKEKAFYCTIAKDEKEIIRLLKLALKEEWYIELED